MKATELRPCDGCGHPLTGRADASKSLQFYRVTAEMVLLNPKALNQVLGMHQFFGGKALTLAEVFAPDPEVAVPMGHPTELLLCLDCYAMGDRGLAGIVETRNAAEEAANAGER